LAERCDLLARERGRALPSDTWKRLAEDSTKSATGIVASLVVAFGENAVLAELEACAQEDRFITRHMLEALSDAGVYEDDDEDEDGDEVCAVVGKPVFIVSDCTGESAERTVLCALGQFGHCFDKCCPADITTYRFCNEGMLENIVEQARHKGALIVYTLVDPSANKFIRKQCEEHGVEYHDLWSPLLDKMEGYLHINRLGIPGRRQFADEKYMQMIECIEYTRTLDDGVQPKRWGEADLMLIGPSRSGKTPLAFFMAQRGYKVANYPIVPDENIPKELYELDQRRIFALTIDPAKLASIRSTRMRTLKMGRRTVYADRSSVQQEMQWINRLYRENPTWMVVDTTDTGIEESCAKILQTLQDIGFTRAEDNPSAI